MRVPAACLAVAFAIAAPAAAQCSLTWAPALSGLSAVLASETWDPDGPGPQRPRWVVATQNEIKVLDPDTNTWTVIATAAASDLLAMPDGSLLAGGNFTTIGGVATDGVARWNGTSWSNMPFGMQFNYVSSLVLLPDGSPVLGTTIYPAGGGTPFNIVSRWTGSFWSHFGGQLTTVGSQVAVLPDGTLVASGSAGVQQWTGTVWVPLGSGPQQPTFGPTVLRDGSLMAISGNTVLRWHGGVWTTVYSAANQWPARILELPDGNVLLLVNYWAGGEVFDVRRWNGATAPVVASGSGGSGNGLQPLPDGSIEIYGDFNSPYLYYARLVPTCMAVATSVAAGCPGSGGGNVLTADQPWRGGVLRSFANGLPTSALVVSVLGFGTAPVPLSSLLPQGQPGCTLHPTPDSVAFLVTANGSTGMQVAVPNTALLVGLQLYHQMIPGEIDAASNLVAVTATNTLRLVIGAY